MVVRLRLALAEHAQSLVTGSLFLVGGAVAFSGILRGAAGSRAPVAAGN